MFGKILLGMFFSGNTLHLIIFCSVVTCLPHTIYVFLNMLEVILYHMDFVDKCKGLLILYTLPHHFNSKENKRDDKLTTGGKIYFSTAL